MADDFDNLVAGTVKLQQSMAEMLRLTVDVLRGPDNDLREDAIDKLASLAETMDDSSTRLSKFQ